MTHHSSLITSYLPLQSSFYHRLIRKKNRRATITKRPSSPPGQKNQPPPPPLEYPPPITQAGCDIASNATIKYVLALNILLPPLRKVRIHKSPACCGAFDAESFKTKVVSDSGCYRSHCR